MDSVETEVYNRGEREIPSTVIGELVIERIRDLDPVAYVRFASVYREFKDVETFMEELKKFLEINEQRILRNVLPLTCK